MIYAAGSGTMAGSGTPLLRWLRVLRVGEVSDGSTLLPFHCSEGSPESPRLGDRVHVDGVVVTAWWAARRRCAWRCRFGGVVVMMLWLHCSRQRRDSVRGDSVEPMWW